MHWCWSQLRPHRWGTDSARASSGQVQTTAAAPGTGHLKTRSIIPSVSCSTAFTHKCDIGDPHLGKV
jgi:hypothetical protein